MRKRGGQIMDFNTNGGYIFTKTHDRLVGRTVSPVLCNLMKDFDPTIFGKPPDILSIKYLALLNEGLVFRCTNPPPDNLFLSVNLNRPISFVKVSKCLRQPTLRRRPRYRSLTDVCAFQSNPSTPSLFARRRSA